jgi:hypothetical protein
MPAAECGWFAAGQVARSRAACEVGGDKLPDHLIVVHDQDTSQPSRLAGGNTIGLRSGVCGFGHCPGWLIGHGGYLSRAMHAEHGHHWLHRVPSVTGFAGFIRVSSSEDHFSGCPFDVQPPRVTGHHFQPDDRIPAAICADLG